MKPRTIYVISDLHLGGDPHADVPGGRGFRMCQQGGMLAAFVNAIANKDPSSHRCELVVAGDFIDFLAERPSDSAPWVPFHRNPEVARGIFRTVADLREPAVFDALARLVGRGHRLTILLGNHDLELSLPAVRHAMLERIGAGRGQRVDVEFVYDNEAYVVGDLIIEHGNQADALNRVDFGELRRVRAHQSRRTDNVSTQVFAAPHGSYIVAELMNDVKAELPFIDLLKPETRGAILILVALKPSILTKLPRLIKHLTASAVTVAHDSLLPGRTTEVARGGARQVPALDPMSEWIRGTLPASEAVEMERLFGIVDDPRAVTVEVASVGRGELWRALSLLKRFFREDGTFDANAESGQPFLRAAEAHARAGFRCVVFGHTHLAVQSQVEVNGHVAATYLNTGTWADLLRVPKVLRDALASGDERAIRDELADFLARVKSADFTADVLRRPTFGRILLDACDDVVDASVRLYQGGDPELSPILGEESAGVEGEA